MIYICLIYKSLISTNVFTLQIIYKMDLVTYQGPQQSKQGIIDKQEYGTYVQKDKKKKKKKNKQNQKPKQIDEQKLNQMAQKSQLLKCTQLTPQQKQRYAHAQNHPLKIICSNLPFKITSQQLFQYFNTLISTSNPQMAVPPPIKDVQFDRAKTFAILTMSSRRIKDFFSRHTEVNYIQGTTTFKMVRPKQFFAERYLNKKDLKEAGQDNKIYLGGLPLTFMDEQVKKICEAFGRLKFFNLVKEGSISKGYCFFQYEEHKNAQKAIKALNGFPISDKRLKCHAATLANKGLSLAFTPASNLNTGLNEKITKPANHSMGSYLLSYENITSPEVKATLVSDPLCKIASRVLQFMNMFYAQDLYDEQFVDDLQADVRQICLKYGPIQQIVIPRPDKKCGYSVPSVGKVLVKFMYIIHAKKARHSITGRVYNKRTCVASFYPEQKFNTKQYLVTL